MSVEAIKEAIADLPADERASLLAWLVRQDTEEWDEQMERDFSAGGAGMALLEEAESDTRAGRLQPMDDFLDQVSTNTERH